MEKKLIFWLCIDYGISSIKQGWMTTAMFINHMNSIIYHSNAELNTAPMIGKLNAFLM